MNTKAILIGWLLYSLCYLYMKNAAYQKYISLPYLFIYCRILGTTPSERVRLRRRKTYV